MGHYEFLCLPGFICAWNAATVSGDTNTSLLLFSSPSTHSMDSYLLYVAIGSSVRLGIRPLPLFVLFLLICFVCSATGGLFIVSLFLSLLFVLPFFVCFESLFASGFGAVGVAAVVVFLLIIVCFFGSGGIFACIRF